MNTKQSTVMQIMSLAWHSYKWNSWAMTNHSLNQLLSSLISLNVPFEDDDFKNIYESFSGHYWFGVSSNGNYMGENFYSQAIHYNSSACLSFEKWVNRKPFLIKNHRLGEGTELIYKGLYCRVSGFSKETKRIYLVGYKTGMKEGKRNLFNFDNKEFLKARKEMKWYR